MLWGEKLLLLLDRKRIITITDKLFLKLKYKVIMRKKIDFSNPQTFNEKLQWLKLYDRNPEYTKMVDKYEVKKYVSDIIGKEYIIPTLGIYDKFDDIDFDKLPSQFVIKCTHDSGSVIVCKDKEKFDLVNCKKRLKKALKHNFYYQGREWPYKNVKPRILIEEYKEDESGELKDYKVYAFNGKAEYLMVCFDRFNGGPKFIYYDENWNIKKNFSNDGIKYGDEIYLQKPKNLDKMFEFARLLSKGIPFVRVDFYEIKNQLYFGELTFFPSGGFDNTRTVECNKYLDKSLIINIKRGK